MAGRQASNTITRYAGIQIQTSAFGMQIPVGWGTFRCRCNLVDYLDFKSKAQKASSGKGGGGSGTTGYSYSATIILALCEGPIDSVSAVYVDSKVYSGGFNSALTQAGLSLATGAIGQAVWSYLTTSHPSHAIGYSGLAIAYAANYALGSGAATPNHSFEVVRTASFGVTATRDADPSLVAADFFTNARYGVPSWSSGLLGDLTQYQAYALAAGLLISPVIDAARSASDFLTELLLATNSTCVWSEGVLKFIPYGDTALTGHGKTYTPNLSPVYVLDDDDYIVDNPGDPPLLVDIVDQSDAFNTVQIEYLDRANQYNMAIAKAADAANVAQFGERRQDPTTVHMICDANAAAQSAQLYLQRTLYTRAQYRFKLGWMFAVLEPGDLLELTDAGLGLAAYPVRIVQIDEDEQYGLSITCEDAQIGVANSPLYIMQTGSGTIVNSGIDPGGVETNLLLWSGDQSNAAYARSLMSVTANAANDQYGLATADALVPLLANVTDLAQTASAASSTTLGATTLVDSPAGNLIVVWLAVSTGTITSVTDSAGNTYTAGTAKSTSDSKTLRPFYKLNAAHLVAGGTITATFATAASNKYLAASTSTPLTAIDVSGAGTNGTGTAPSIATGTLAQAGEVVFGSTLISGGNADSFTTPAGWTNLGGAGIGSADALQSGYIPRTATTTVTYAPTLGTSRNWAANVLSFKAVASTHGLSQSFAAFDGQNYAVSMCLQKNVHKIVFARLGDVAEANCIQMAVDLNTGTIIQAANAQGTGVLVSARLTQSPLNAAIYQLVLTGQFPAITTLKASIYAFDDAANASWMGDGSSAVYVSQLQAWQGLDDGRVYAATTSAGAAPLIFNPPSALYATVGNTAQAAVAGGPYWGGANVWMTFDGTKYEQVGSIVGPARFGVLTASYALGADPDTTDTLAVDLGASGGALTSASDTTADNAGTLCLVDNELVSFSTATLTNPSRYNLTSYIRRGVLNTDIASHAVGDPFVRMDSAIFEFPYLAPNVGQIAGVKFQSFNLWGDGLQSLSNCIEYGFTPAPLGSRAPGGSAWTAVGDNLSNAGVSTPVIKITGASDNPSATGVVFYFRQHGVMSWTSAGLHPISTTLYYIAAVASAQTYDVGVAYQVNGVIGDIQVIATAITVGSQASGNAPGTDLLNDTVAGTSKTFTCPAGSYTHIDVYLCNIGGQGYFSGGKSYVSYGASGSSSCVRLSIAVTPGVTVVTYTLPSTQGTPATLTVGAVSLNVPSGISATSSGPSAAPAAATGGTTNYTGHAGGLIHVYDGGGCFDRNGVCVDQNTSASSAPGTSPGGGSSGAGSPAPAQLIVTAR